MKNLQFVQKRSMSKVLVKECEAAEEISTIKMAPSTLYQEKKKDALRLSQESAKPTYYNLKDIKVRSGLSNFKDFCWRRVT
jgi:hypothetical protein